LLRAFVLGTLNAMKTITITEAKRSLGRYLKRAAAGEDIGIVAGADIISLRKVEVIPADRLPGSTARETPTADDWPEFPTFDGGPADGALHHDKYIYDEPNGISPKRSRK
jgi:antitoxin (DNA-binding transcriptional repressor) of toxin-antitoxin stability system